MSATVLTLRDYLPIQRSDGIPWNQAQLWESTEENGPDGPWTAVKMFSLSPVDANPMNPQERTFTYHEVAIENGWYKIRWLDGQGGSSETEPVQNLPTVHLPYLPTLAEVGNLIGARTVDKGNNYLGTFTNDTSPTSGQVLGLIDKAARAVRLKVGDGVPSSVLQEVRELVALRAAMLVELTYFPEQVAAGKSPYDRYQELWREQYGDGTKSGTIVTAVTAALQNDQDSQYHATEPGLVHGNFPPSANIMGRRL